MFAKGLYFTISEFLLTYFLLSTYLMGLGDLSLSSNLITDSSISRMAVLKLGWTSNYYYDYLSSFFGL